MERAVAAAWPFRAIVADSFYGENETFRTGLEQLKVGYVLALKPSHCWWHVEEEFGSLAEAAEAAAWEGPEQPGAWEKVVRSFRDGHDEVWWALEVVAGPYGPEKGLRAIIVTTDPVALPALTTWYLVTNLPLLGSERAAASTLAPASVAEIVRLYGLRMWVEQSYKQVKHALGWAEYQVRSDVAMRRHWVLVWCAFSFCWWQLGHGAAEAPAWLDDAGAAPRARTGAERRSGAGKKIRRARCRSARGCAGQPRCGKVRAWLEPWIMLGRYWRAWSPLPPPPALQALLAWVQRGFPLYLYEPL